MNTSWRDLIEEEFDRSYMVDRLVQFLQTPSEVPTGETMMAPDHPRLVHYVQAVIKPELESLGLQDLAVDDMNNLIVKMGSGESGRALLMMAYTVAQHHNLMEDPHSGRIANARQFGYDEDCAFGQGASRNKGSLAAILTALKIVTDADLDLKGRLSFAINNEGRSSHACSTRIIEGQGIRADYGVLCRGTDLKISLGNRGRVDVIITVKGQSAHSSTPQRGLNAIDGANEVMNRLKRLGFPGQHPSLGQEQLTVYGLACSPIAPHTMPDTCRLTLDRRLLPGSDIGEAVAQIRQAVADVKPYTVTVERGVYMYPAQVDPEAEIVREIKEAQRAFTREAAETFYATYTFDAGYPCRTGIPTVMYGPSVPHQDILGTDFVPLSRVEIAAKVYAHVVLNLLGVS